VKTLGITLKNTFHLLCAFVILHEMTSLADTCTLSLEDKAIMELSRVQGFNGVKMHVKADCSDIKVVMFNLSLRV